MDRNINHRFNSEQYEQYLSAFGKKVLQVLTRQWNTRCDHNKTEYQRKQYFPNQNKRVLTFNNSHAINTPMQFDKIVNENDLLENNWPDVPKSVELIDTLQTVDGKELGKDYLAYPDEALTRNLVHGVYNKISDDEESFDYNKDGEYIMQLNKIKNIVWDDMFDSELLPDAIANVNLDINSYLRNEKNFEKPIPDQDVENSNNFNLVNNKMKLPKRKTQTKVTDAIPKKVKKIKHDKLAKIVDNIVDEETKMGSNKVFGELEVKPTKNTFRKHKYTKSVKNWLNDVNPNNPVEEVIISTNNIPNTTVTTDTNTFEDKGIGDVKTTSKAKKVIQAQLANKDGVMKFSKPKQPTETSKLLNESKALDKEDLKERKVKKFIAPIKSQIPVRDKVFEVCTVGAMNIEEYEYKFLDVTDNEIFVTLIYSNGFSQLNSYHTDKPCIPDGIILNNDEIFYCLESTHPRIKDILIHLFEKNKIICYDGKTILIYLASLFQIEINTLYIFDAQIGGSLLDPDNSPENFSDLQKLLAFTPEYTVATECKLQKAAWYLSLLKECWVKLSHQLMEDSLWSVFVDIETPLLPIVAKMEHRGVKIDLDKLNCMELTLLAKLEEVEQECYAAAGKVFQINSTVQVRAIIYDELQLDTKCNVKIRETICKGVKSTSETMLRGLVSVHPLPKLILEYRQLHKAHATFLAGIAQHVTDGVVRPTWVQTAAATGRIASNNPNLQAIPKAPFSLYSSAGTDREQLSFRSIYVSREGHVLLAADFKHVECRVFAHAAADTGLLDALQSKEDLFRVLAAKWLNKAQGEVSSADRERTKRIVYASLYGAGTRKLMDILDVSYEQALAVVASFHRTFPSLKSFGRSVVWACSRGAGRLCSLRGRARRLPGVASADPALRAHAERQAVNFVLQGSAADLCKTAMILTEGELRGTSPPVGAHLLLQLHDELVWEVERCHLDRAARVIKRVMEECGRRCGVALPLPVALRCGASWGNMTDLTLG